MAIADTLQRYLEQNGISYQVQRHVPTPSASRTAQASHVPGDKLAKGVLVKHEEAFALVVLPASHHVRLGEISRLWGAPVGLATEGEVGEVFPDCALGAVPAVGNAYGLDVVADERLFELDEVYFEGGDHETLVRVSGDAFGALLSDARRGRFTEHD